MRLARPSMTESDMLWLLMCRAARAYIVKHKLRETRGWTVHFQDVTPALWARYQELSR